MPISKPNEETSDLCICSMCLFLLEVVLELLVGVMMMLVVVVVVVDMMVLVVKNVNDNETIELFW